jgi:predicted RNA-binding Zn ribbon-like protein
VTAIQSGSEAAPGALDLIRRFENTAELPNGPDELDSLDRARAWCLSHGLAPAAHAGQLRRLREFREVLRDLLFANNGEGDGAAAWESLTPFLAATPLNLCLDPQRGLQLRPATTEPESAIATLLTIVYESVLEGTWPRLRACRKQSCRFAYFDQTKNGSRAWCSMATCGNQAKAQRRRQRERNSRL